MAATSALPAVAAAAPAPAAPRAEPAAVAGAVALFAGWIGAWIRSKPAIGERLNVFAGITFIALGIAGRGKAAAWRVSIGALTMGYLTDRLGRRRVLTWRVSSSGGGAGRSGVVNTARPSGRMDVSPS